MSKWINDRAWTVSMYICYALCFIILSVAGYNYTMSIIGETSSIMKVVLFICIILFVGFGVSMVFSIFITPLSELLSRLLWYLFRLKTKRPSLQTVILKCSKGRVRAKVCQERL